MKKNKINLDLAEKKNPSVSCWGDSNWNFLTSFLCKEFRSASKPIVPFLVFLRITPNQVTFFSAIINFGLAAFCFTHGKYWWNLAGLIFLILHYYFDFVDGSLARSTKQTSRLGRWLDLICDYLGSALILASLGYGVYKNTADSFWLIIVILIIFAKFVLSVVHLFYGNSIYRSRKFQDEFKNDKKMTPGDWLVKEFVVYESFFFLFIYTIAYSLFFAILFNLIPFYLVAIAFFYNFRWLVLILVYAKVLKEEKSESRIIKLLRAHIDGIVFDEKLTG